MQQDAYRQTTSVWTYVLAQDKEYANPFYREVQEVLRPVVTIRRLKQWNGLFFRWNPDFFYAETGFVSANAHKDTLMRQVKAGERQLQAQLMRSS